MLGLLQGGEAAALIMEPTPIAQAMRQTAVAPAQPCLCERIAYSVALLILTLPLSLSVNMWLNPHVTEREGEGRDALFLHSSGSPFEFMYVEKYENGKKFDKTVGFAFAFNVVLMQCSDNMHKWYVKHTDPLV